MNTILLTPNLGKVNGFAALRPRVVSSGKQLEKSVAAAGRETLWISADAGMTVELLKLVRWPARSLGSALLLHKLSVETLGALQECFSPIAFAPPGGFLSTPELVAALRAKNRADLVLCGTVDKASRTVRLFCGNLDSLVVPFSAFSPSGDGVAPDFDRFSVADYGHTVRLGKYEAAVDAILYEFDADYRRRKAKERLRSERGLGASLRRLRKERRLRREDFAPLAAKTIARIEQGKIKSVRPRTLTAIAKVLGVKPDELEDY
ncbi:MAG: helix-turn-helix transcriptional regulator [Planctomycetia bacterium]|nr:helix-turn-helix transcriptional regulator [Planctomycetia bacterium]